MYNILTLNKISKYGLAQLDSAKYACSDACDAPDAIMVRSAKMHDYAFAPNTLAVARAGAGVNNIPVDDCAKAGIAVFNTPGANANAVKELVLCALLMSSRKIAESVDWCKTLSGKGSEVGALVEKGKSAFAGPEIMGKTLGAGIEFPVSVIWSDGRVFKIEKIDNAQKHAQFITGGTGTRFSCWLMGKQRNIGYINPGEWFVESPKYAS